MADNRSESHDWSRIIIPINPTQNFLQCNSTPYSLKNGLYPLCTGYARSNNLYCVKTYHPSRMRYHGHRRPLWRDRQSRHRIATLHHTIQMGVSYPRNADSRRASRCIRSGRVHCLCEPRGQRTQAAKSIRLPRSHGRNRPNVRFAKCRSRATIRRGPSLVRSALLFLLNLFDGDRTAANPRLHMQSSMSRE